MFVIMSGMLITFFSYFTFNEMTFSNALHIGQTTRWISSIFHWSWREIHHLERITGGFFLALAYFGTDTSGSLSVRQIGSWKPNGFNYEWALKVPMQFFILLTGVMVFSNSTVPLNFNPNNKVSVYNSSYKAEYQVLEQKLDALRR
jgi:hypothetical protein